MNLEATNPIKQKLCLKIESSTGDADNTQSQESRRVRKSAAARKLSRRHDGVLLGSPYRLPTVPHQPNKDLSKPDSQSSLHLRNDVISDLENCPFSVRCHYQDHFNWTVTVGFSLIPRLHFRF